MISPVTAPAGAPDLVLEDLGASALKGVAEPMAVWRVVGRRTASRHDDEAPPNRTPFLVGRDEELGLLRRRWEQSKEGLGQVVLLSGAAGLGKSSLVTALRVQVGREGYARLTLRCSPYYTNSALYPVIEHLQQALQFERTDPPATKLARLEQGLQTCRLPHAEVVPLFGALLAVPLPAGRYAARSMTPQQQRQQTQDALVAWLLEEATRQPVLAVWEDLHWADPTTLELLGLLVEQTPTAAMLHVLTFRPEFSPPWPTRSHLTPITLNRLERPQVEALIAHLAGGKALPAEVVAHIVAKTDGVPLYVEELTKMVLASDLLRAETEHYVLTGPLSTMAIPETLQDSLMARLDQLPRPKRWHSSARSSAGSLPTTCSGPCVSGRGRGARRADPVGGGRAALPAGTTAARPVYVQACPHPGCRLCLAAAEHAAAGAPAGGAALGGTLPRDRRDPTRVGGPALHCGGLYRTGSALLAAGRPTSQRPLSQCGSHQPRDHRHRAA